MDALFVAINAKYIHTNNAIRLLHANSALATDFIEFTIKDPLDDMVHSIQQLNPKVIGISTYIWNVEIVKALTVKLKSVLNTPIILGGPEVSYDADTFLKTLPVNLIVKGEGEHIVDQAINHFIRGTSIHGLTNLAYQKNGTIHSTPLNEILDLSRLNSPYYDPRDLPHFPHKISYIETSRGCPFQCSYCLSSLEKRVRFFPLETIKNDLHYLINNNVQTFKFLDRTFNANKNMLNIIDFIIEHHKPNQVFQFEITGDILDEKIIDHIHKHAPKHLFRFEIGIQSTHDQTNRLVDRIQDNHTLFKNITLIKEKDIIDMHLDLIAGLPEEDLDAFKKTFNDVFALGAKELQLGFLKMLRGTKIRNEAARFNYQYHDTAPYEIKSNHVLHAQDIAHIHEVETTLNVFHNKNHFAHIIYHLAMAYGSPFDFFALLYTEAKTQHQPLLSYQLHDLYSFIHSIIDKHKLDPKWHHKLKTYYLKRSNVKPKLYFEPIKDKSRKQSIYQHASTHYQIPLHIFYKHGILIEDEKTYTITLYQDGTSKQLYLNKADI